MARHPFDQPPRVDEHQRRAMRGDELGQPIVDLGPGLAGHDRLERRGRQLQRQIAAAHMAAVDDGASAGTGSAPTRKRATSSMGLCVADRPMRVSGAPVSACRRSSDSARCAAALVARDRMNLIDDHRARRAQHFPAGFGGEQNVQRLRRGHDDVRRTLPHAARAPPARCRRCAPPCGSPHRAGRARRARRGCPRAAPRRLR